MAKQKVKEEEPKEARLSRPEAAARVVAELDGEFSLGELVEKADGLVVAGAESNPDAVEREVWRLVGAAEELGLVEVSYLVRRKAKQP